MKKSVLFCSILVITAALFISCDKSKTGSSKNKNQKVTLVMAEVNPETSICGQMDAAFKQKVEQLSEGNITVDIQYSGVLGNESQVMSIMKNDDSTIQLARVSANLSAFGGQKSKIVTIPYTYTNSEHFWKFAASSIAEDILQEPYDLGLGVKGLCYAEEGFRHFFSTEQIKTVDDMKGKRMRVSGKILPALADALGAEQIQVPFTELYTSMQIGNTEVADQPISNYLTNSFYEVAPYMIKDGHMIGAVQILIHAKTWDSLSQDQQEIIKTAADYASSYCKTICTEQENEAEKKLIAEGATIIELDDIRPWQDACKDMISESSKEYADLYQKILTLGK